MALMPADLKRLHKFMLDTERSITSRMKCAPWWEASGLTWHTSCRRRNRRVEMMPSLTDSFGLRMAACIAQCLNLEREFHHTVSKLCILGFEPLK
jgi:hypothetical protein